MNSMRYYHYHSGCDIERKVNKGCGGFGPITEQFCLNPNLYTTALLSLLIPIKVYKSYDIKVMVRESARIV